MTLRLRTQLDQNGHFIIEDEFCNPMFIFIGTHIEDALMFINRPSVEFMKFIERSNQELGAEVERLEEDVERLEDEARDAKDQFSDMIREMHKYQR